MSYRPFSQRENPRDEFDGPFEGVPSWMVESVRTWVERQFRDGRGVVEAARLRQLELAIRVDRAFDWPRAERAMYSMLNRISRDQDFALDVVDWLLRDMTPANTAVANINSVLTAGGSAFEAQPNGKGGFQLGRRAIGPVSESIEAVGAVNQRAHAHLTAAWAKLVGRNPDPPSAYREAVRAVEVAAAPVVIPDDPKATLGTIIAALQAKPEKWTVDLARATPQQVTEMCAMLWQSQFDRHGTPDEDVPLHVSQEEADAAVHIAIALVRLFAGGHVKPAA